MILWSAPTGLYVFTFFRPGYWFLEFFPVVVLAAIGLDALVKNELARGEVFLWTFGLADLAFLGVALGRRPWAEAAAAMAVLIAVLAVAARLKDGVTALRWKCALAVSVLAALALPAQPVPRPPTNDRALTVALAELLSQTVAEGTRVLSYAPGPVWMAHRLHQPLPDRPMDGDNADWFATAGAPCLLVDRTLMEFDRPLWKSAALLLRAPLGVICAESGRKVSAYVLNNFSE
ncbi:MAG: hypothetical protein M5R36_11610 [Deltaproteobacteria bacterium]|nr:hypothetical protein [Deltaproteobacteria bacterium]